MVTTWKLEPELASPIPRRIVSRFDYLTTAILLAVVFLGLEVWFYGTEIADYAWLFLIPLGVMAISYLAGQQERWLSRLLVSTGTATRGVVVECTGYWHIPSGPRPVVGGRRYRTVIAYDAAARGYLKLDRETVKMRVGETLTVLYMPGVLPTSRCLTSGAITKL